MPYNQTYTWRNNKTNFSFFETSSMYSPSWYVSDGHLFASLLIKSDNYELLEQTPHWLFWPRWEIPRTLSFATWTPLERKSKSTLLQSTRRLKQVTPPILPSATLASPYSLHSWRYYKHTQNKVLAAEPTSVRQSCERQSCFAARFWRLCRQNLISRAPYRQLCRLSSPFSPAQFLSSAKFFSRNNFMLR